MSAHYKQSITALLLCLPHFEGIACSQPLRGSVSGCILSQQTSPHHPANALSHLRMIWSAACAGEPSMASLPLTRSDGQRWSLMSTEGVQMTFLDLRKSDKGDYLAGCQNASFMVAWSVFMEKFVEEVQLGREGLVQGLCYTSELLLPGGLASDAWKPAGSTELPRCLTARGDWKSTEECSLASISMGIVAKT